MINQWKINPKMSSDLMFYVELAGAESNGAPIYEIHRTIYLKSYVNCFGKLIHIVLADGNINCCVVRHVPDSRLFATLTETDAYIELLKKGGAEYEH